MDQVHGWGVSSLRDGTERNRQRLTPIRKGVLDAVGNTPLVGLTRVFNGLRFQLFGKLEGLNPGGSMKDRPALKMLVDGLASGEIARDAVIVESSSGNMGIGLAQACSYLGLRFICVVDSKTTAQNVRLLKAYGARVEQVTEPDARTGELLHARLNRVADLLASTKNAFWPNQYSNVNNPLAHHQTMREIATALGGRVDMLFCSTSTCGTLRGCAEHVRRHALPTKIIAVDAIGSVIFGGEPAKRLLPGHGAAVRPALFQPGLADEVILVSDLECITGCRLLARREAILAGASSGAVVMAVHRARPNIPDGAVCAAILADRGERYLDTVFCDEWVESHFGAVSHLWDDEPASRRSLQPVGASHA
jgi:N-(2-amino-2-carboxyethyl)-L-glutamate synthase